MSDITLNLLTKADIELVRIWRNSSDVAVYMYSESHITEEQQIKWFEKASNDNSSVYWIIEYKGRRRRRTHSRAHCSLARGCGAGD